MAVPDSIAQNAVALFSGQLIAPITGTQATLESGNFAGTELNSKQVQNAAVIINKGKEMGGIRQEHYDRTNGSVAEICTEKFEARR